MSRKFAIASVVGGLLIVAQVTAALAYDRWAVGAPEAVRPDAPPAAAEHAEGRPFASTAEEEAVANTLAVVPASIDATPASSPPLLDRLAASDAATGATGAAPVQASARVKKNSNQLPSRLTLAIGGGVLAVAIIAATSDSSESD